MIYNTQPDWSKAPYGAQYFWPGISPNWFRITAEGNYGWMEGRWVKARIKRSKILENSIRRPEEHIVSVDSDYSPEWGSAEDIASAMCSLLRISDSIEGAEKNAALTTAETLGKILVDRLTVKRERVECRVCDGSGVVSWVTSLSPICPKCNGTGVEQ